MTDLPTLIADVYRACGWDYPTTWRSPRDGSVFAIIGDVGLDAFIRDIVPTLNERGWEMYVLQDMAIGAWEAQVIKTNYGAAVAPAQQAPTPVEACFRAAWEALMPSESPDAPSHHPSV